MLIFDRQNLDKHTDIEMRNCLTKLHMWTNKTYGEKIIIMYAITEPNAMSVVVAIVLVNFSHLHLLQNHWVNF